MGGIGGALFGTAETKSSYYCLCLLLTWQKILEQYLCIALPFSPPPQATLQLFLSTLKPTPPEHYYYDHAFFSLVHVYIFLHEKIWYRAHFICSLEWYNQGLICPLLLLLYLVLQTTSLISPYLLFFNFYT